MNGTTLDEIESTIRSIKAYPDLIEQYAQALANLVDPDAVVFLSCIELGMGDMRGYDFVLALSRLTEAQKIEAAKKVLADFMAKQTAH